MFVHYITTMLVHYNKLFHSPWGTKKAKRKKKKCRKNIQCKKNSKLKKSDFSIVFLLSRIRFRYYHISHLCIFYFFQAHIKCVDVYISIWRTKNIELFSQKIIFLAYSCTQDVKHIVRYLCKWYQYIPTYYLLMWRRNVCLFIHSCIYLLVHDFPLW